MKITITIPQEVYEKLEVDRGLVPRATYIQQLIRGVFSKEGPKLESKVPSRTQNKTKKEVDSRKDILDELLDSGEVSKGVQNIEGFKTYFK